MKNNFINDNIFDDKRFSVIDNSSSGEVSSETIFHYHQKGDLLWGEYSGGGIRFGNLIAKVDEENNLDMRYQHLNEAGKLMTGTCFSRFELLEDNRIRMHEEWRWTSEDKTKGRSIIEEIIKTQT